MHVTASLEGSSSPVTRSESILLARPPGESRASPASFETTLKAARSGVSARPQPPSPTCGRIRPALFILRPKPVTATVAVMTPIAARRAIDPVGRCRLDGAIAVRHPGGHDLPPLSGLVLARHRYRPSTRWGTMVRSSRPPGRRARRMISWSYSARRNAAQALEDLRLARHDGITGSLGEPSSPPRVLGSGGAQGGSPWRRS